MVMLITFQTIIQFIQQSHSGKTIMEKYIEPTIIVVNFDACQVLCASFDDKDHTEKWEFDDLETI